MNTIEIVPAAEVRACKFKPEPHTVAFSTDPANTWYAYKIDGKIAAVLSVARKHGGIYIGSVYTEPQNRGKGVATKLIRFVAMQEYPNETCIAHCLITSKAIFERLGFVHYKTIPYKHGTQYFVKREVKQCR